MLSFSACHTGRKGHFQHLAPPIIVSEILEISKMIIGGAIGKVLKMAFPANMASCKAQNLILP